VLIYNPSVNEASVSPGKLTGFAAACLEALGLAAADARLVAETLVESNLRGVDSHGVVRLPHYAKRLRNGTVKARPQISVRRTGPSTAMVEGDAGMGQLVAVRAMQEAISLAKQTGVGAVGARNSSHCGACAYFVELAVRESMVGVALTHTDSIMVPPGMKNIFLGSNPIAFGAPGGREPPVIIDLSTTHAAWGKVIVARQEGKPIPPDWGVDSRGKPTTDAAQVVGLAPTGGHKGYALALMIEILCAHLAGVPFGMHVTKMYGELDQPRNLGHFMLALDVARFTDPDAFRSQLDLLVREIRAQDPADPSRPPLAPGDPERLSAARRAKEGIPLPDGLLAELNTLAASLDIAGL
jgi:LDH2 family malate/lactate/ureidoglycolate dehydrogenase